jgi:antirestriction protein ArdC
LRELEKGSVPWHKPWKAPDGELVPTNFFSKKPYRGINTFLLTVARIKEGWDSNYWLTYKQIEALGGRLSIPQSEMVVFWKFAEKPAENSTDDNKTDRIPVLRYYRVYNVSQVAGIKLPNADDQPTFQPIDEAEQVAAKYQQVDVIHGGSRAFYRPSVDRIRMPAKERFDTPEE